MSPQRLAEVRAKLGAVPLLRTELKSNVPWVVSDTFPLSKSVFQQFEGIGKDVKKFLINAWKCHDQNNVAEALQASLTDAERIGIKRLSNPTHFPVLVRLDLILDEDENLWIVELDLVPAGAGQLQRFQEVYGQLSTIADVWAQHIDEPMTLSIPDWKIFAPEQEYFVKSVNDRGGRLRFLPIESWDTIKDDAGLIFKNCCTISLLNDQYPVHIPSGATITPPTLLDWKGWMALARQENQLRHLPLTRHIPETYLLPLQPGKQSSLRRELLDLSKKERKSWILKPSTDWGSHGFLEAHHLNRDDWNRHILGYTREAKRGMILQRRIESRRYAVSGLSVQGEAVTLERLRIRLNPYYLIWNNRAYFCGATVVLRRSIKVHGATDAVITLAVQQEV